VRSLVVPLVAAAALLAGCDYIYLEEVSEPPPTKRARVYRDDAKIALSRGVALAVECTDTCDGPCRAAKARSRDEGVLAVKKGYHFAGVARGEDEEHNAAVFVLVGVAPGSTELELESDCTDDTFTVEVVP
jgi:hypothetical protein